MLPPGDRRAPCGVPEGGARLRSAARVGRRWTAVEALPALAESSSGGSLGPTLRVARFSWAFPSTAGDGAAGSCWTSRPAQRADAAAGGGARRRCAPRLPACLAVRAAARGAGASSAWPRAAAGSVPGRVRLSGCSPRRCGSACRRGRRPGSTRAPGRGGRCGSPGTGPADEEGLDGAGPGSCGCGRASGSRAAVRADPPPARRRGAAAASARRCGSRAT